MYLLLADGAIGHKPTAIIAILVMIARPKIAILLLLPTLPASPQLTLRTSRRNTLIIRIDPAVIDVLGLPHSDYHLIGDPLLLLASAPRPN